MTKPLRASSALLLLAAAGVGFAADYTAPRTPYGVPDLQGTWTNSTITTLERSGGPLVMSEEDARRREMSAEMRNELSNAPSDPDEGAPREGAGVGGYNNFWLDVGTRVAKVRGEYRTSLIVYPEDGQIPYSEEGRRIATQMGALRGGTDHPEQQNLGVRCILGYGSTGGPPMIPVLYNNNYQIVQSPGYVMILVEMNHDARIIRIGDEHLPDSIRPWLGDSVGRWEGDTLVVETTNFNPGEVYRAEIRHRFYISTEAKVIERFTRVAENEILYEFTVEDPDVFTQPWRGEIPMHAVGETIYEYACHEGNYSMPGILGGARAAEGKALN